MKTFMAFGLFIALTMVSQAAEPAHDQTGPKNLVSPTYRGRVTPQATGHQHSTKEVTKRTTTPEQGVDHWKLAGDYRAEADRNDAEGKAYEAAAAAYRRGPSIKNLMAPTTSGRYEYLAKELREKAKSARVQAASHEQQARLSAGL